MVLLTFEQGQSSGGLVNVENPLNVMNDVIFASNKEMSDDFEVVPQSQIMGLHGSEILHGKKLPMQDGTPELITDDELIVLKNNNILDVGALVDIPILHVEFETIARG